MDNETVCQNYTYIPQICILSIYENYEFYYYYDNYYIWNERKIKQSEYSIYKKILIIINDDCHLARMKKN